MYNNMKLVLNLLKLVFATFGFYINKSIKNNINNNNNNNRTLQRSTR